MEPGCGHWRFSRTVSTNSRTFLGSNGLATTSAPHTSWDMAASCACPLAVRIITGKSLVASWSRKMAISSSPLISGIMISVISRSGGWSSIRRRASLPLLTPSIRRSFRRSKTKIRNREPISSLGEYLELVEFVTGTWDLGEPWFRGVSDLNYPLVPSIYRPNASSMDVDDAVDIYQTFIPKGRALVLGNQQSKSVSYHIMQNHGLPT